MVIEYENPTEKFVESIKRGINNEIEKADNTTEKGRYFLKWILINVFHATDDDAENGIVDGPHDCGIDAVLEVHGGDTNFFQIIQSKFGKSHNDNEIRVFRSQMDDFVKQNPNDLPEGRMRDVLINIKKKKWDIEAIYVTNQKTTYKSKDNFQIYDFERFTKKIWDDISEPADKKTENIYLENSLQFNNTIIGIISLRELGELVLRSKKYIFESNIRKFLPVKTKVNKQLRISVIEEPEEVFYYNNGVTIVAKEITSLGGGQYRLIAPQIVNGAQTSNTVADVVRGDRNIVGYIQITIITEDTRTTRNNITKFRNSQNAVKGRDLISLERFHDSITVQLKAELGYYYESQAGSWVQLSDAERNSFKGHPIFNQYLSDKHGMKISANDAIQAMAAVVTENPAKPYGSISKFLPGGSEYENLFKNGLEENDDYRLLFYPYLVKSFAEKEFNYGSKKANIDEKKYARLLFVTTYFIALQDFVIKKKVFNYNNLKSLDPYFINFETNKKLLSLVDEILNRFFIYTHHIRQDEDGRDKITLHNFFSRHVWSNDTKNILKGIMNQMRKTNFQKIIKEFESSA